VIGQWADRKGFVVVYPDGYKHNWNECHKDATFPAKLENIDDMGFIHALIARMAQEEHGIDIKHVFVLGYSNDGQMAFSRPLSYRISMRKTRPAGASQRQALREARCSRLNAPRTRMSSPSELLIDAG
jgi:polyhydroxybutyrate depolymerase